jgi:UDP-N-acetylmuramoylalanine--D-glutamate ligase
VTLSPACAAFDQFKNFMVRGETYKTLVRAL